MREANTLTQTQMVAAGLISGRLMYSQLTA